VSLTQYRALEALASAPYGMMVARDMRVPPGRIHPRTAEALARRSLADLTVLDTGETLATVTDAGVGLLARNPRARQAIT
jgi:hypothetical protein